MQTQTGMDWSLLTMVALLVGAIAVLTTALV
jgi:hypothetical protein